MSDGVDGRSGLRHYGELVVLQQSGEQAWCVERTRRQEWTTYWSERGNPAADQFRADSIAAATHILVGRLVFSRLLLDDGRWSDTSGL